MISRVLLLLSLLYIVSLGCSFNFPSRLGLKEIFTLSDFSGFFDKKCANKPCEEQKYVNPWLTCSFSKCQVLLKDGSRCMYSEEFGKESVFGNCLKDINKVCKRKNLMENFVLLVINVSMY